MAGVPFVRHSKLIVLIVLTLN